MFVIADDLIGGSFVFHRQPSAAPAYLQQLLAKTRSAHAPHACLSFARISFDQRLSAPRLSESDPRASLHGTVNLNSCQYGLLRGLWGH